MSERSAVQNPMLKYAREVGWEYVKPDDALGLREGDTGLYFVGILEAQLVRLNPRVVDSLRRRRRRSTPQTLVWVAIDVAKDRHEALIEAPGWRSRKRVRVARRAKIARVAYALIRSGADYRCFPEVAVPSGRTRSARAVEAISTS